MTFRALYAVLLVEIALNIPLVFKIPAASIWGKWLILACGVVFVATHRKIPENILLYIALGLVTFMMALATTFPEFNWERYFRGLVTFMSAFIFLTAIPTEADRKFVLRVTAWLVVICFMVSVVYASAKLWPMWRTNFFGGGTRLQLSEIPAGLGSVGYIGCFAAMLCVAMKDKYAVGLVIFNAVVLLLCGARGPLFVTVPLCMVVYATRIQKLTIMRFAGLTLFPVVGLAFVAIVNSAVLERITSGSLSGRQLLWDALETVHARYPWFGIGLGHSILVVPETVTRDTGTIAAHNEYIRMAVDCGDIGMYLLFGILGLMCFNIWRSPRVRYHPIFLAACMSFFVYSATDNTIESQLCPLVFLIASSMFPGRERIGPSLAELAVARQVQRSTA